MSAERGFPRTAACLREFAEEILSAWEEAVRARRAFPEGAPSSPALRNDIPEMIEALAAGLESPLSEDAIPDRSPYDHALQRFAEDVPLEKLVDEYGVLRSKLFEVVAREVPSELPDAWPQIASHLDRAIEEAVAQYGEQRRRWLSESEQQLTALLEELPVGVAVAEAPSGRVLRTNRELVRIQAGISEAKTIEDAAALGVERLDGSSFELEDLPLSRALRGEEVGPEELRVHAPTGPERIVESRARPLRDRKGRVWAAVAIATDVSERVRTRMQRQLVASTLGHDVRSPLSTIRIAAQRLQQIDSSETVQKLAGGIVRSAAQLSDLVTQLLDVAKSWEQRAELNRERLDLAELASQVASDQSIDRGAVSVRIHAPSSVVGHWDRHCLVRIVENLVQNAKKHADPRTEVEIDVRREGESAVLAVSNRGTSLSGERHTRLFEPYHRGRGGRGEGAGLGLYIVKDFAEAHGGRVEIAGGERVTTFRVLLPSSGDDRAV